QIGGAVKHRAIRFHEDQRRHFFLVRRLSHRNDQRTFADFRDVAPFKLRDHRSDQWLDTGLAFPEVEMDSETAPFALKANLRDRKEMLPQRAIAWASVLQFRRRLARFFQP